MSAISMVGCVSLVAILSTLAMISWFFAMEMQEVALHAGAARRWVVWASGLFGDWWWLPGLLGTTWLVGILAIVALWGDLATGCIGLVLLLAWHAWLYFWTRQRISLVLQERERVHG